ncbi:VanZ family protein [Pollutibacter soli]|uniref:VanZ family protein n=1 Tax=Pollutibacter soli TaxID=3034157 RepID=UPI0030137BB0
MHNLIVIFKKLSQSVWIAIAWTIIIFILLVIPQESIPEEQLFDISDFDKIVHCILFGFFLWFWACWYAAKKAPARTGFQTVLVILVITIIYGLGMEYYQKYFTSRDFDFGDVIADSLGAVIAAIVFWLTYRKK